MAITIKGIRIDYIVLERDEVNGKVSIKSAQYSLISSTEHVLATQSINGYSGLALKPTAATLNNLDEFLKSYHADVLSVLGLDLS